MPPARTTREAEMLALLASGLSKHRPLDVTFAAVGHEQAYVRSLYLRAEPSARLTALHLAGRRPGRTLLRPLFPQFRGMLRSWGDR
jgi:hypothetical protein